MAGLSKDAGLERVVLSGGRLRIDEVVGVARGGLRVELADAGRKRMTAAREVVERVVAEGKRAYGVSTGFGLLANTPIAPSDLSDRQRRPAGDRGRPRDAAAPGPDARPGIFGGAPGGRRGVARPAGRRRHAGHSRARLGRRVR